MIEAAVAHDAIAVAVQRLEAAFRAVAAGPMRDLPLNHARLQVQAVGFAALHHEPGVALGVLVTPWCMNLLRVPLRGEVSMLPVGRKCLRSIAVHEFEFIGAHEPAFGAFEMCSLFSPVLEFADHDAAVATAREALAVLRSCTHPTDTHAEAVPSRRGFLFGRVAQTAR